MRGDGGRFTRYVSPSTHQLSSAASQQGTTVSRMAREAQTPDTNVGSGPPKATSNAIDRSRGLVSPVYPAAQPWPEANTPAWSPHNVQRNPMRLR